MGIISEVIENTRAIIKGMLTTASYIPREKWTVQYPDEPVTLQPRFRGQHLLHVDELHRAEFESGVEDALQYRPRLPGAHRVGLDDSESEIACLLCHVLLSVHMLCGVRSTKLFF